MLRSSDDFDPVFRSSFAATIFQNKFAHEGCETWSALCRTLVEDVCAAYLSLGDRQQLVQYMTEMKFIPGGRYLYYAGRPVKAFNNCYLLRAEEDTREDWAMLSWKAESCLSNGGGIGTDYSVYRRRGAPLVRTGGQASGPISKMRMINEIGREVMQGGSRRSALYASLNWRHPDIMDFLREKNWQDKSIPGTTTTFAQAKYVDFNFPAPLDMTNISVNYDTGWLGVWNDGADEAIFLANCEQALRTGEPGFSFNFHEKENETLRNACTEVTSENDSDVCNLGSLNLARIESLEELRDVTALASKFLLCGTLVADLPYEKVSTVREKNRRLGLGLMGVHEWLVQRGYKYGVCDELGEWLCEYELTSAVVADVAACLLNVSRPIAVRAVAPTGTIGILAGTTTGIEPVFAVAYKRRYLTNGTHWKYQYVIDSAAQDLIQRYGTDPEDIESALSLAKDWERRISFQAFVQKYVDHAISSTINLPPWGSEDNNESRVSEFADLVWKYAPQIRGLTCYPDGSRGGQPLTRVPYMHALQSVGKEFEERVEAHDICDISGRGGVCGG